MSTPALSVVICTHNPREAYLSRVLQALAGQTLARDEWELVIVDNGSNKPVVDQVDLSFQPNARVEREDQLGLTHARLRGIRESRGETIVFVDDDNVLAPDYLAHALEIGKSWPQL